jgi:hypothetical protein
MRYSYFSFTLVFFLIGCVNQSVQEQLNKSIDISTLKSICVERFEHDKRNLNVIISKQLVNYGVKASAEEKCSNDFDAILTYRDKWRWDITTYMLGISMKLNDPNTGFPLAYGQVLHTSLTRQTPEENINEVLGNIFIKK